GRAGLAERWLAAQAGASYQHYYERSPNSSSSSPRQDPGASWSSLPPFVSLGPPAGTSGAAAANSMRRSLRAASSADPYADGLAGASSLSGGAVGGGGGTAAQGGNVSLMSLSTPPPSEKDVIPESLTAGASGNGHVSGSGAQGSSHSFFPNGNEKLYEAYNDLHSLAQDFHKPFDAPAILVVGHQTDGKSALVEALMGFQFNHVGGGTKTRRPITLHMKYNAACVEPRCYLVTDDRQQREEEKSLEELQVK
ncbi:hypothetical protein CBR_g86243, partial [Chara braunii]